MIEASEQIKRFKEFFQTYHYAALMEGIRRGDNFFVLNFSELAHFDPTLSDLLLEQPTEALKAAELSIEQFDLPIPIKDFTVRVTNLPLSHCVRIRDIRSKHLGLFFYTEGVVKQKSDVRPQVTHARFECPSCGNIIPILQLDQKFKEPSLCGCGRKGKFRLLSKDLVDVQRLVLEEAPEDLEGGEQPKRIQVFLKDDLVSPMSDKKTNPGSKIRVVGVVKEIPIPNKTGGQSTRYDLMMDGNFTESIVEDYTDISISHEEVAKIKEIAQDPKLFPRLVTAMAPSIYGFDRIKEALLLQLAGGIKKQRSDGVTTRGDIHVLLVGDPGSGKSQLLKRVAKVAPKSRYVSGKGVSGAGLTAAVVKDEFLNGWSLEAGALPLANKGFVMIDEMDKMSNEDRSAMHEGLEQQTVSISKATIQATLRCETTVLAAANPKFGRFDPYGILADQIDMPPALINRFDLIFPIKDLPDEQKDEKMASHILGLHQNPITEEADISTDLLRKYIAYVRQRVVPVLTEGAIEEIKAYYVEMRNSNNEEGAVRSVPISARQLEALVRLSEASAKLRLGEKVTKRDAKRAIDILHFCLVQIGIDPETGKIDIDRIATGITASQRGKIMTIKEIITDLEAKVGKMIPHEEIKAQAAEKELTEEETDEIIEKLKRGGEIYEPKRGFISKI